MTDRIAELEKALAVSVKARVMAMAKLEDRRRELYTAAYRQAQIEHGDTVAAAVKAESEAEKALEMECDRVAREGVGLPFQIGTVFEEYKNNHWTKEKILTGKKGVFEVVTLDTDHGPRKKWSRAKIGGYIIRHLKKDGTPGSRYETFGLNGQVPYGWRVCK